MNILDDHCALCGKKLKFFDKHEHYNIGDRIPYEKNAPRPYFCSDRCLYWAAKTQVKDLTPREPPTYEEWYDLPFIYSLDGVTKYPRDEAPYPDFLTYFQNAEKGRVTDHLKAMHKTLREFREKWLEARADAELQRLRQEDEKVLQKLAKEEAELAAEEHERALIEQGEREQEERMQKDAERALSLPYSVRYEGVSITGPAGSGKTHLLQELILNDLTERNPPGIIVMDPKGLMVKRLARLDYFNPDNGRLRDRVVVIDAAEKPYPALNLFANTARTSAERDILFSQAISTFRYIFSSGKFNLTPKQANCFGYCVAVMFEMKGTLSDIQSLLRKGGERDERVQAAIRRLPDTQRSFFVRDFSETSYGQTRDEIITRLNELMLMPAFVGMFDQRQRKIDLLDCIQKRKIVLINTGMNHNKLVSQMLGRLFISMLLNAAQMRTLIHPSQWHPVMFYCDEFLEFADSDKTPELLRFVREYNIGCTVAFHNMFAEEMTDSLRSSISTNTRTKFAYNPKGRDLPYLTADFGCRPEFFAQYPKTDDYARFICSVDGIIPPTPVTIPWLNVQDEPQMTEEQARWVWGYGKQKMAPDVQEKPKALPAPLRALPESLPKIAPTKQANPQDDPDYFPRA
ncbi:hypothetical protein XI02_42280 [Bradyrhizobium sp. CCBAU 21365]|uniref:type IV secretion system DNA-binding domain-containing protein n=1 Tax=Bradyrhizobium sp. CCBAU 21365 TaxID=1325083 RepID=UPI00188D6E99|nr:type IV secretion system DNA-binding domain-containing protein [Bradyrhizobium sp. CCBAU 21365]QOZ20844.1 hypothetical protein XI02_42280 [Bradyrhizobium sp. CCBAU 21365]